MDTLKNIQNAYDAWIAEHPEKIGDIKETAKWLALFLSGAVSGKVAFSQIIYHLILDYNNRVIKQARDAKNIPVYQLRSKL